MKLQSKINRYYLIAAFISVLIGVSVLSIIGNELLKTQRYERLRFIKERILKQAKHGELHSVIGIIHVEELSSLNKVLKEVYKDTTIYSEEDKRIISQMVLEFSVKSKRKNYKVILLQPVQERIPIIRTIIGFAAFFVFIILLLNSMPNRIIKKIWLPFYSTLEALKKYKISQKENINLPDTDINEFEELNREINILTNRIRQDYLNMKEFTENASHEIQTPIAVIKSKIELYLQKDNLDEEAAKYFQEINEIVGRLSKLNQSLLLLAKIENHQFGSSEEVNLEVLIEKQLKDYEELFDMKNISISKSFVHPNKIIINAALADILIMNLIKNAFRYCSAPGSIRIEINGSKLSIANTGRPSNLSEIEMFERFKKSSASTDSLGLGLSIVKKICDANNFLIRYSYQNQYHTFEINYSC